MFGYYKKRLFWITERLRHQEANLDDLQNLLVMQRWLTKQIFAVENRQRSLREERKELKAKLAIRMEKAASRLIKKRVTWIDRRHERLNDVAFVLRAFGDGIAFLYLDAHAVKPLTFEGDGSYFKRSAGTLSGKSGLATEILVLEEAIRRGVPAILCDLTNSIRHGDVCLLGNSDPYLIEVKAGSVRGHRSERQRVDVGRLNTFFENDRGELLGAPMSTRASLPSKPVDHIAALNLAASEALEHGQCVSNPEPGVWIVAQTGGFRREPFDAIDVSQRVGIYSWNGWKMDRAWLSYRPFTLHFRSPEALYAFISGRLFVLVLVDYDGLLAALARHGIDADLFPDEPYMIAGPWPDGTDGRWGLSAHYVDRLGVELLSPEWFASAQGAVLRQAADTLKSSPDTFFGAIPTDGALAHSLVGALASPTPRGSNEPQGADG